MLLKADIWHHIILLQVHQRNVGKQNIGLDLKALPEITRNLSNISCSSPHLFDLHARPDDLVSDLQHDVVTEAGVLVIVGHAVDHVIRPRLGG